MIFFFFPLKPYWIQQQRCQSILLPLVSNGKRSMQTIERTITTAKRKMAAVWWQPVTNPTDTRGHTMPPIRPTALAMPAPVALSEVGYTYSKQTRLRNFSLWNIINVDKLNKCYADSKNSLMKVWDKPLVHTRKQRQRSHWQTFELQIIILLLK